MRTSYSALDTYKNCPLQFKLQNLDKIRAPRGIESVFGSTIHSALKYMFERSPLYPTVDEVVDFFRSKWEDKAKVLRGTTSTTQEEVPPLSSAEDLFCEEGISLLKNFYKKNQPWNFNTVDSEARFEVEIEDPKNGQKHILAGIIDRIDKDRESGVYEIIDYKTAKKMPSQDIIDQNLQMSIYTLGLTKKWPHLSPADIKLSLYYLKHGEKISTKRAENQMQETKNFVIQTINEIEERIEKDDFPPYPSPLCGWCGYKQMCPMWKHEYSSQSPLASNEEEIKGYIKEYNDLKNANTDNTWRLSELKTLIYGFMDDQKMERVFGDEFYITRKMQERSSYDIKEVAKILAEANQLKSVLTIDEKKLEKLLQTLPAETQQKILTHKKTKQFPVLTVSKRLGS